MDVGLKIPATLPQVIAEVVDVGQVWPDTLNIIIADDVLIEVDIGHKRLATIPLAIMEQEFLLKGEVDIGLISATISPLTKANVVDCWIFQ